MACEVAAPVKSLLGHGGLEDKKTFGHHGCRQKKLVIKINAAPGFEK